MRTKFHSHVTQMKFMFHFDQSVKENDDLLIENAVS